MKGLYGKDGYCMRETMPNTMMIRLPGHHGEPSAIWQRWWEFL